MPDPESVLNAPAVNVAKLPDIREKTGNTGTKVSLASNLPHGLTISHAGHKLTIHGANHPKAIATGSTRAGLWGITPGVPEDWYDDWVATHNHAAVRNGLIVKNTAAKIEANVETLGDAIKTGTEAIDPDSKDFKLQNGVESVAKEED